ncbi:MAG: NADP-dependent oxidoreductase [Conexibacter sp.]|nr:NADP-dependent oxidoreductase [Conexibacter sp.]
MSDCHDTCAQVIDSFGGVDRFRTAKLRRREPGPDEIRVRVAATSVNPVDLQTRAGRVVGAEAAVFPMVLGWDVAGTIEKIGRDVEGWQVGDRVAAMSFQPTEQNGTYAQRMNLASGDAALVPDVLHLTEAATIPLAGLTASQLVRSVGVASGGSLLIDGAMGAVGRLAVQLASQRGIMVLAAVKAEDRRAVIALGASDVLDRGDFLEDARDLYAGGVDGAIDLVGGDTARTALASVRDDGTFATAFTDYDDPGDQLSPERGIRVDVLRVHPDTAELTRLLEAAGRGALTSSVERTYPLSEAAEAHRRQEQGGLRGKLVLLP